MSGGIKNASQRSNERKLRFFELLTEFGGVLVVLGLAVEYGPDVVSGRLLNHDVIGGLIVLFGVVIEVAFAVSAIVASRKLQSFAEARNAELYERAAKAEQAAAEATERAAKEQSARVAMLSELKPRGFTKEQMDNFVEAISGKVPNLNVFTPPDPEAAMYAFTIMNGLKRAGVNVVWYRQISPYFLVPGVSSSGLTLYESPGRTVGPILMEAFLAVGELMGWFTPENPSDQDILGGASLSSIPSPALFIALKQPPFHRMPEYLGFPPRSVPWNPT